MTYDEQIERLTKNPSQINSDWMFALGLFKFIGGTAPRESGCLTQIRCEQDKFKAVINGEVDEKLTLEIANDDRLPFDSNDITVEHLPVFKEWQERIDKLQTTSAD